MEDFDQSEMDNEENLIYVTNTNARSLCPKIDSMIDCFEEMKSMIGIIANTWLADGDSLQRNIADLAAGAGIGLICRNRNPNVRRDAHEGVAISYRVGSCTIKNLEPQCLAIQDDL